MSRIDDVPVYAQRNEQMPAELYNLWRLARLHLRMPLRLDLPSHAGVAMIIEEQLWVCVDVRQNDLPILAWLDFEDQHRDALHLPVHCQLNYYHFAASRLRAGVLADSQKILDDLLHPGRERPDTK